MTSRAGDSRVLALIVACAMLMAQLDGAVVVLALPAMAGSFGVTPVQLTIGITSYLMVQVILLPTGGWITDRFGARNVFASAIVLFTIASVFCALSRSLPVFVTARILQGSAAALMAPVGRIVLLESTSKQDLIRVMTITTVPMLAAPTLGPAIGGFITTYWSWPWIFLLNVPFGIAGTVLALRLIPDIRHDTRRPFDALGFVLFAGASTSILYALERLGSDYPRWLLPAALMAVGIAMGVMAIRHVRRHPFPIFSLASAAITTFSIPLFRSGSLVRFSVRAMPYLLPLMFQLALGMNALHAGIMLLALNGGDLVLKTITTRTLRRHGFRNVLLVTTVLASLLLAACALFSASTPYAVIFVVLLASGMVRSLLFSGMSTLVFADVPQHDVSSASVIFNIVQQGISALGVSVSAILLAVSAQLAGEAPGQLALRDFQWALLAMAALGMASLPSFRQLPRDAGSHVSGHQPPAP